MEECGGRGRAVTWKGSKPDPRETAGMWGAQSGRATGKLRSERHSYGFGGVGRMLSILSFSTIHFPYYLKIFF